MFDTATKEVVLKSKFACNQYEAAIANLTIDGDIGSHWWPIGHEVDDKGTMNEWGAPNAFWLFGWKTIGGYDATLYTHPANLIGYGVKRRQTHRHSTKTPFFFSDSFTEI